MDKSEYIKMCDCPEIQKQWKPEEQKFNMFYIKRGFYSNGAEPGNGEYWVDKGEIAFCGENDDVHNDYPKGQTRSDGSKFSFDDGEYIWLPLQHQIQKMLGDFNGINILINQFYVFCLEKSYKANYLATAYFNSMEQLWLAFYMWEKHGKVWNGEEWITYK